jgi:hypothetical protein
MMFVNDAPSSLVLTEPHGEAEFEVGLFAIALSIDAMPDCRCEGHIVAGCDSTSSKSNKTGLADDAKNVCQVFI